MTTTAHLGLTLVDQAQAQKEVTINTAFNRLDAILNAGVIDKDLATPPGSPAEGDVYIVAASPTGAWTGQAKSIAYYNQAWKFIAPNEGLTLWVKDEDVLYTYNGSAWAQSYTQFQNLSLLGVNATADATNKLAVASSAVLFNHAGAGTQVKLNKNASGDTASFLFQDNFSGRAEIGLVGNDDFLFKVSPDGSTFYQGIILDKSSGRSTLKGTIIGDIASGYTGSGWVTRQAGVQTTNGTATVIASIALAEGEMIVVDAVAGGFRNDYTEAFGARSAATFRRGTGGNVTLVGSVTSLFSHNGFSGTPAFTLAANTGAQTVELKVTGEAAKTVNWVATYSYMKILTNS